MATLDRFQDGDHSETVRARRVDWAFLQQLTTWFGVAAAGMVLVFIGLGIDAYRHNHGAGEETLLSMSNPGHLVAAIGIALATAGALVGLSMSALRGAETRHQVLRRVMPVGVAWMAMVAAAAVSLTYIGATGASVGHSDGTLAAAHNPSSTTSGTEAGGIVQGLQANGISSGSSQDPSSVPVALVQGSDGHNHTAHDKGKQPTFSQIVSMTDAQLLPLFPAGTMTLAQIPQLRSQLEQVRAVAEKLQTTDAARAAGYVNTTSDVPFMGQHWLNFEILRSGIFDPSKPDGLLFSNIDKSGTPKLVGIWYLMPPGLGGVTASAPPSNTWVGNLALWHEHDGLCLVGTKSAS